MLQNNIVSQFIIYLYFSTFSIVESVKKHKKCSVLSITLVQIVTTQHVFVLN